MDTERFVTPDGEIELVVVRESGDITLGFAGFPWHTHGDVLVGEYALAGLTIEGPEQAVERFLYDLTTNVAPISILRKCGSITDIWATVEYPEPDKYLAPDESVEIRYWNGGASNAS